MGRNRERIFQNIFKFWEQKQLFIGKKVAHPHGIDLEHDDLWNTKLEGERWKAFQMLAFTAWTQNFRRKVSLFQVGTSNNIFRRNCRESFWPKRRSSKSEFQSNFFRLKTLFSAAEEQLSKAKNSQEQWRNCENLKQRSKTKVRKINKKTNHLRMMHTRKSSTGTSASRSH